MARSFGAITAKCGRITCASLLMSPLIAIGPLMAAPAYAASADQEETADPEAAGPASQGASAADEDIVVTGSRIPRPDLEAASQVTVVQREELVLSGTTAVEDLLRNVPQAVPAIGGNTNLGNPGAATVDLRNLGEERTLVLVDGKRFVPYDANGVVDLNMIPTALIERVEVLTGGASSVYGSDAVAGVVNFVLRRRFEGVEADGQIGITERGDGHERSVSLTAGAGWAGGRGNILANATYVKADPVTMASREFSSEVVDAFDLARGGGSSNNASGSFPGLLLIGGRGTVDSDGNLVRFVNRIHGFNYQPFNLLQVPQNKWTATLLANYELGGDTEIFARASFADSRVTVIQAPTATFGFPFRINYATNPFLSGQARSILAGNDTAAGDPNPGDGFVTVGVGRRILELGTRDRKTQNRVFQLVGGLRGSIAPSLDWEAFAQWGRTRRKIDAFNDIALDRTQQAILAVAGPSGPVCSNSSGGCVPANIFGAGRISPQAADFIRLNLEQDDETSQLVAGGFLTYELPFRLGGTRAGGAVVGAEYRRESVLSDPDENLRAGNAPGFGGQAPVEARLEIGELYGEISLPLFDIATLEAGGRYSRYENLDEQTGQGNRFNTFSYKIGGDLRPVSGLRLRAMYQRAVRAPNLAEIGTPRAPGTIHLATDPCSSSQLTPAEVADPANASLVNLCVATGAPRTALQAGLVEGPIAGQANGFSGGNIDLVPETARTLTAGIVLEPKLARNLTLAVDYFDIRVRDAIVTLPAQEIVDACYFVDRDPTGRFCSQIQRNPLNGSLIGGTETGVDSRSINAGLLRAQGVDFNASYNIPLAAGTRLNFAINATRLIRSDFQSATFTPRRECAGLVGAICNRTQPKWRFLQTSTFSSGGFTGQLRWRYVGRLQNDTLGLDDVEDRTLGVPVIGDRHYFDLFAKYELARFTLRFGINNLLDKQPPVVGDDYGSVTENGGNTYPATYDPLGRSFFVGVTVRM